MSHNNDAEWDNFYRSEHVRLISKTPGYRRMIRYTIASRSVLSSFERSFPEPPTWLAVHEFDGTELPWKALQETDETEWAKKLIPGIKDVDFGVFKLSRVFEKELKANL
jgi:hypothetical protein